MCSTLFKAFVPTVCVMLSSCSTPPAATTDKNQIVTLAPFEMEGVKESEQPLCTIISISNTWKKSGSDIQSVKFLIKQSNRENTVFIEPISDSQKGSYIGKDFYLTMPLELLELSLEDIGLGDVTLIGKFEDTFRRKAATSSGG